MALSEPRQSSVDDKYGANHLERLVDFALELQDVIAEFNDRMKQNFVLKMGINAGPAVTGILGTKQFAFDVWGDAVNVASRMESTGIDGHIQTTQIVYETLKNQYEFEARGKVYVKGKGEMDTYFILGKRKLHKDETNIS
ncbi:hypothetical protein HK102_001085 [Quaeritorhiza haematococci]|nr:hypothetical protein HK102_001085 [Quaeritorhiza haematococci]